MRTSGDMRIFANRFIREITRKNIIQDSDIRWLKDKNGQFPLKFVWSGKPNAPTSRFEETPYSPEDTFIVFDIIESINIASERINNKVTSKLPFRIIINIYGQDSPNEAQYILSKLYALDVRSWLSANKVVIDTAPSEILILDGRENAQFWIRRRLEIEMSLVQTIMDDPKIEEEFKINEIIVKEIKNVGDK